MKQINTFEFAETFSKMTSELMQNFKYVGKWSWGNPSGIIKGLPTYEITSEYGTVWCSMITWCDRHGNENRECILTTLPSSKNQSLGQIAEITIPYEFNRSFNTRAFGYENKIEIRNYGKFTVGRAGLKKLDFFNYLKLNKLNSHSIMLDEENKQYIKVFEFKDILSTKAFADQIVKFTLLIDDYKRQYRK